MSTTLLRVAHLSLSASDKTLLTINEVLSATNETFCAVHKVLLAADKALLFPSLQRRGGRAIKKWSRSEQAREGVVARE